MKAIPSALRTPIIVVLALLVTVGATADPGYRDVEYRVSPTEGLLVSGDRGETWVPRNDGLPGRVVYPFDHVHPPRLTAIATDAVSVHRLAVAATNIIYVSEDAGLSWRSLRIKPPFGANDYLTALALSPHDGDRYMAGTSFHGFFETLDGGSTWQEASKGIPGLYQGAGFFDEISALAYDPVDPDVFYYAVGFGGGLFRYHRAEKKRVAIAVPSGLDGATIRRLDFFLLEDDDGEVWALELATNRGTWLYRMDDRRFRFVGLPSSTESLTHDDVARQDLAENRYGIYVSSANASGEPLERHLEFLSSHGMNAIVVDFKDDMGNLTYDSELEQAHEIGAVRNRFRAAELIEKAHERDIYVIARVVVFKDMRLYRYQDHAYALWDPNRDAPWGHFRTITNEETGEETKEQVEHWVDGYSPFVWDYNIAVARELQARGVDEIQFDYIRFPSDGDLTRIRHRHRRAGMRPVDALESFLKKARGSLHIPLSTDVYGFNAWARMDYLGQNIGMISRYVDAISPMFYPSHFSRSFLPSFTYLDRATEIYRTGTRRALEIVGGRALIRPFVQAFLIGGELEFDIPTYTRYLHNQIDGSLEGSAAGFLLWNQSNRYYMVTQSLAPYTRLPEAVSDPDQLD